MTRVACGSAHTLAWSTDKPFASKVPTCVPMEYDLLKELPPSLIRNRLMLLLHFSDLLCPSVSMFPLMGDVSLDSLRGFLVYMVKEITFRKVQCLECSCELLLLNNVLFCTFFANQSTVYSPLHKQMRTSSLDTYFPVAC